MKKPSNVRVEKRFSRWEARISSWRGKRYDRSFETEEEARAWAHDATSRMLRGLDPSPVLALSTSPRSPRQRTLGELLTHTIAHHWNVSGPNGRPLKGAPKLVIAAKKAIEALGGDDVRVGTLTYERIETALLRYQHEQGNAPATTNRRKSALNVMMREAVRLQWIEHAPQMRRAREDNRRHFRITLDLESGILQWAIASQPDTTFYDLVVLMLYLGSARTRYCGSDSPSRLRTGWTGISMTSGRSFLQTMRWTTNPR